MTTQTVCLRGDSTDFSVPCECCLSHEEGSLPARHRAARVAGTLRADVDVGVRTCRRGHRILVKRVAPSAA
jgi:hypothetical protein